eukprot:CAMPEP_0176132434 /NCGR_PEP_ID=MMETSP0120_2-20121206/67078_1 /TAXON_ID=160619 /ORGANISM="Kryptoperidinium foliaceum, Strain CCMP 1326" /LENGTH=78 /DNA_ID=CAMNT_0017467889 /DNA_START=35 /DNA_END=269 /DNA_ORIENTATION=+
MKLKFDPMARMPPSGNTRLRPTAVITQQAQARANDLKELHDQSWREQATRRTQLKRPRAVLDNRGGRSRSGACAQTMA